MVDVLVGKGRSLVKVYESILRADSPYFDAAMKREWREGMAKEVELPGTTKHLFNTYFGFLYSGAIAVTGQYNPKFYEDLSGLYALGERLLDDSFKDVVISALKELWNDKDYAVPRRPYSSRFPAPMPATGSTNPRRRVPPPVVCWWTPTSFTVYPRGQASRAQQSSIEISCSISQKPCWTSQCFTWRREKLSRKRLPLRRAHTITMK